MTVELVVNATEKYTADKVIATDLKNVLNTQFKEASSPFPYCLTLKNIYLYIYINILNIYILVYLYILKIYVLFTQGSNESLKNSLRNKNDTCNGWQQL